jgi:lysophospholipid acyltransferase 5
MYSFAIDFLVIDACANANCFCFFRYLFKRLRFLGNKTLSHVVTLMFLAIWHGIYIGYFICFITEYFYITAEKQVQLFHGTPEPSRKRSCLTNESQSDSFKIINF